MERAEGGALDRAEDGGREGARPARLGVPEEGALQPPGGPEALQQPGGRRRRAGGLQKNLPLKLQKLEEAHPEAEEVELWAEDEARLGLKPVMRRVWAPVGERPTARFERGYEWTYLYGFVRPESGEVSTGLSYPRSTRSCSRWPCGSSPGREVGAGKGKRGLLGVDKAGGHTGGEVEEVPDGIHLESSCPRARRSYSRRRGCGRSPTKPSPTGPPFEEIEQMEETLVERCVELLDQWEVIRRLTNYHW